MADALGIVVLKMTPNIKEVDRDHIMAYLAGHGKGFAFYFKCNGQILQSLKLRREVTLNI